MTALYDQARLAALRGTDLLDGAAAATLDRYVRIAQAALQVPVVLVSLVDDRRQFFSSQCGLGEPYASTRETPLSHSFCKLVVASDTALVVEDARVDPRVAGNGAIRDLSVVAYAGFPIETPDAGPLGSFCAIDTQPRRWSERELDVLRELAEATSDEIQMRRRTRRAEMAERSLTDVLEKLETMQELSSRTSRQNTHDLRAPLQVMTLGIEALRAHAAMAAHPELVALASMLERNLSHTTGLVATMHDVGEPLHLDRARIDIAPFFAQIIADLRHRTPALEMSIDVELACAPVYAAHRELRRSLDNVVTNAQRFAAHQIVLRARTVDERVHISVDDDGPGLSTPDAYAQAWQATARFHRTEGKSGTGLGLAIVRSLVEQLGGTVSAGPSALGGASFGFWLPAAR